MGAPSDLFLVVDMQNCRLVSLNGSPAAIPDLFQSDTRSLKIQCANPGVTTLPTGSATAAPYVVQNMTGYGMRVSIGDKPTGTPGGPTPVALQTAMVWDGPNSQFVGDLALNTTGVNSLVGVNPTATGYFEIKLVPPSGTNRITIFQGICNLRAVVDEFLTLVPTPTERYLTADETNAKYMPRVGAPGDVLTLAAPTSGKKVEIGLDDQSELTTTIF